MKAPLIPDQPFVDLSPLAVKLLLAFRYMTNRDEPHPCGGFTREDAAWRAGELFTGDAEINEAMDELIQARAIRFVGEDLNDPIGICYELTPKGGAS